MKKVRSISGTQISHLREVGAMLSFFRTININSLKFLEPIQLGSISLGQHSGSHKS